MTPARGKILVEPVQTEECMGGGRIIIPDASRERLAAYQMRVVAVGEPELCEDDDCERLHDWYDARIYDPVDTAYHPIDDRIMPGAWVYVQPRSLINAGDATKNLYFVGQDDVLGIFAEAE